MGTGPRIEPEGPQPGDRSEHRPQEDRSPERMTVGDLGFGIGDFGLGIGDFGLRNGKQVNAEFGGRSDFGLMQTVLR